MSAMLDIKNPAPDAIVKQEYDKAFGGNPRKMAHDVLKEMGYDSIIRNREVVVFYPSQIHVINSQIIESIRTLLFNIKEDYLTSSQSRWQRGKDFDIYKNPSPDEFREVVKHGVQTGDFNNLSEFVIRFIIDVNTGSLYIWNGSHAIHNDVKGILKGKLSKSYITGVANAGMSKKSFIYDLDSGTIKDPDTIVGYTREYFQRFVNLDNYTYIVGTKEYVFEDGELRIR